MTSLLSSSDTHPEIKLSKNPHWDILPKDCIWFQDPNYQVFLIFECYKTEKAVIGAKFLHKAMQLYLEFGVQGYYGQPADYWKALKAIEANQKEAKGGSKALRFCEKPAFEELKKKIPESKQYINYENFVRDFKICLSPNDCEVRFLVPEAYIEEFFKLVRPFFERIESKKQPNIIAVSKHLGGEEASHAPTKSETSKTVSKAEPKPTGYGPETLKEPEHGQTKISHSNPPLHKQQKSQCAKPLLAVSAESSHVIKTKPATTEQPETVSNPKTRIKIDVRHSPSSEQNQQQEHQIGKDVHPASVKCSNCGEKISDDDKSHSVRIAIHLKKKEAEPESNPASKTSECDQKPHIAIHHTSTVSSAPFVAIKKALPCESIGSLKSGLCHAGEVHILHPQSSMSLPNETTLRKLLSSLPNLGQKSPLKLDVIYLPK